MAKTGTWHLTVPRCDNKPNHFRQVNLRKIFTLTRELCGNARWRAGGERLTSARPILSGLVLHSCVQMAPLTNAACDSVLAGENFAFPLGLLVDQLSVQVQGGKR
jgi:hypothetical protein